MTPSGCTHTACTIASRYHSGRSQIKCPYRRLPPSRATARCKALNKALGSNLRPWGQTWAIGHFHAFVRRVQGSGVKALGSRPWGHKALGSNLGTRPWGQTWAIGHFHAFVRRVGRLVKIGRMNPASSSSTHDALKVPALPDQGTWSGHPGGQTSLDLFHVALQPGRVLQPPSKPPQQRGHTVPAQQAQVGGQLAERRDRVPATRPRRQRWRDVPVITTPRRTGIQVVIHAHG